MGLEAPSIWQTALMTSTGLQQMALGCIAPLYVQDVDIKKQNKKNKPRGKGEMKPIRNKISILRHKTSPHMF